MKLEICKTYAFLSTSRDIWETIDLLRDSMVRDVAQVYELKIRIYKQNKVVFQSLNNIMLYEGCCLN